MKDAAPPAPPPLPIDASVLPTETVENPLQYAERERAKHKKILAKCPRGKGPCIAGFDFAYFVYDSSWKHHYVIDPGTPKSPLRAGNANRALINHRMSAAAAAVLEKEGKSKGLVRCDSADRFHQVAGLARDIVIDVSSQGAELPAGVEPLKKMTAREANEAMVKFHEQFGPDMDRTPRPPMFSDRELASMANPALTTPRVTRGYRWVGGEKEMRYGRYTVVYSKTSSTVYLDTRVDVGKDDLLEQKNLDKFEKEDLDRVRGLIAKLGIKQAQLSVRALCELGPLGGYSDWIPFKL